MVRQGPATPIAPSPDGRLVRLLALGSRRPRPGRLRDRASRRGQVDRRDARTGGAPADHGPVVMIPARPSPATFLLAAIVTALPSPAATTANSYYPVRPDDAKAVTLTRERAIGST